MKIMKIIIITFLILLNLILSCSVDKKAKLMYLYSKDKSQVVTIISNYGSNQRIIANGKHSSKPDSEYILLDISNKDLLNDEIGICWGKNGKVWQLFNDNTEVYENKFDSSKYVFKNKCNLDERNIPTPSFYRESNCFTTEFFASSNMKPSGNGLVERK